MSFGIDFGIAASAFELVFALVVLTVSGRTKAGRVLALFLAVEALFVGAFSISDAFPEDSRQGESLVVVGFLMALLVGALYPWVLGELNTRLTHWFRNPTFLTVWGAVLVGDVVVVGVWFFVDVFRGIQVSEDSLTIGLLTPAFPIVFLLSGWALIASISAFRKSVPGPGRERARAFMMAFGVRDVFFVVSIALNFSSDLFPVGQRDLVLTLSDALSVLAVFLYVPLLAYGILRTHLFDIDLKVKMGISRSTVVTMILIVALAAAKIGELYLNRTYGWIAGGICAGTMLVLTPRLNKIGDKVANKALPAVQSTPVYIQFKKLEVYRAAVESAHETGGVTQKERASLDRLRDKLGVAISDAKAVEDEVYAPPTPA